MKNLQWKMKLKLRLFLLVSAALFAGCKTSQGPSGFAFVPATALEKLAKQAPNEVSVMTYNVENLFDTIHDDGREDFTYLPLTEKNHPQVKAFCSSQSGFRRQECEETDWSEKILQQKFAAVAEVIRSVENGKGPDVLLLAEVENERVLKQLVSLQLKDLGYQTVVLLEGPDVRGIDPGFISKLPLSGKPKMHIIPYVEANPEKLKWAQRSRGILEVSVVLPNKNPLTFLIGHFPSQANPVEWRMQAVAFAKNLMAEKMKQGSAVVLGGDLNITTEENAQHGFFTKEFSEVGQVSHIVGCADCFGTYNYKGRWDFLDALIFSKNLNVVGAEVIADSFQTVRLPINMKKNGNPLKFDPTQKVPGASDHFPLYSRIRLIK